MKSAVEPLSPTRVRLTVEVPFEELTPDLDTAYKSIGRQVRIAGFRPGKVPPRILDQRIGRGAVLEQAIQEAVPRLYGDALRANEVQVMGQPDVEVTRFADGEELVFTAEVDVRPHITLPEYNGIAVTVDDAEVTDEEVDEQLAGLRERFATLTAVERPVEQGDYVLLDLRATVDGEEVPGAGATGLSYRVGSNELMPGLDDALLGAAEGETRTFDSELVRGELAGRTASVAATVRGVKVQDLPDLDDDFAQTASEFDTIAELRADTRSRLERMKLVEQGVQARDRVLDALLGQVEVPLPDGVVQAEVDWRQQNIDHQLSQVGMTKEEYLRNEGQSAADFDSDVAETAAAALRSQFLLEEVAGKEEVGVSEAELTDHIVRRARQMNVAPDAFARQVVEAGGLGTLASEIVRGKALALILERAVVTDASGRPVDLNAASAEFEAAEVGEDLAADDLPDEDVPDVEGGLGEAGTAPETVDAGLDPEETAAPADSAVPDGPVAAQETAAPADSAVPDEAAEPQDSTASDEALRPR